MQEYVYILMFAIPSFMVLIAIEYAYSLVKGVEVYNGMDTIASLSSGMTNILKDVFRLTIYLVSYAWLVDKLALFSIETTVLLYVLAFIGKDFAGYWSHRFEHVINIFWNRHVMHHSSEEFNLACALRQSVSAMVAIFVFLYIPMAILGIPAEIVNVIAPLHLFAQFWYHTRLINRMGFLEHILVTPSHHRVHHAINDEYMDKNYSGIFIVWDKLFGTFQEELDAVPPVYGIKRPARTWNPIIINFQHLWLLIKDAWRTENWFDKLRIWFMPTGWRPADVAAQYEEYAIQDVYNFKKYQSRQASGLQFWSAIQLTINMILMMFLFSQFGKYPLQILLLGAAFIFVSTFAFTSLMDRSIIAFIAEVIKLILGSLILYQLGSWFGLDEYMYNGTIVFVIYIVLSFLMTVYYSFIAKDAPFHSKLSTAN